MIKKVDHYIIGPETMALFPSKDQYGNQVTIVTEETNILIVNEKPIGIIENSCIYFGSSYDGRKKGTYALMNISHMAPIVISDRHLIVLFPLVSPEKRECVWLSHKHLKNWQKVKGGTKIQFANFQSITLPVQLTAFDNKVYRSAQLRHILSESTYQVTPKLEHLKIREPEPDPLTEQKGLEQAIILNKDGTYEIKV